MVVIEEIVKFSIESYKIKGMGKQMWIGQYGVQNDKTDDCIKVVVL